MIFNRFVPKGWGYEHWLVNGDRYCGKKLFVHRGKKCSFHFHKIKDETFYVAEGELEVHVMSPETALHYQHNHGLELRELLDQVEPRVLQAGDILHLPPGTLHRFRALRDTTFYEFSTTHSDEDVVRVLQGD